MPFHMTDAAAAVNAEAAELDKKVDAIVAIGHMGAVDGTLTNPIGPLAVLADAVGSHVDTVIGDHTNFQVLTKRPNGVLTTENLSKGVRFTRVRLVIGPGKEGVVYQTADFHKPWTIGVTPDAAIQAKIDALNAQLAPILGVVKGQSTKEILRADQCGRIDGRLCESFVGNTVTDALRTNYGTQFAITNSGGLRAALTCPAAGGPGAGFCPAGSSGPPFPITLGAVYGVLPFGNFSVTLDVTGPELKSMLERGVSAMPAADGRFPQVSGLCFTYDIALPVNSRVTGARVANADGSCSTTAGGPDLGHLPHRHERLHRKRWRRVPELQGSDAFGRRLAGNGPRGLRRGPLAGDADRAGVPGRPDQLRGQQRRDDANCPTLTPSP